MVDEGVFSGKKILTAISVKQDTFRSTASLRAGAPGGMLMDGLPANVNGRSVSGITFASCDERAMWAEPIFRALVPNALESLIRTRSPPTVGRMTMRIVWFSNTGEGGSPGNGSGACIAALQPLTQCP